MREMKFNIWVEDEHIMLRGVKEIREYAKRTGEVWSEVMIPGYFSNLRHLQFTGLLDKNGNEIYEGNIVEWDDGSDGKWRRRCEIKWEKTKYILVGYYYNVNIPDSKKTPIDFTFGSFTYEYDGALEIIGNIYANPDLIS